MKIKQLQGSLTMKSVDTGHRTRWIYESRTLYCLLEYAFKNTLCYSAREDENRFVNLLFSLRITDKSYLECFECYELFQKPIDILKLIIGVIINQFYNYNLRCSKYRLNIKYKFLVFEIKSLSSVSLIRLPKQQTTVSENTAPPLWIL